MMDVLKSSGSLLVLLCFIVEAEGQIRPNTGSYVSSGDITKYTALNITARDVYGDRFTLTWVPVGGSWNATEVTSYELSVRVHIEDTERLTLTTIASNINAYTVSDIIPGKTYSVVLSAKRQGNKPDLISNTLIIIPGKGLYRYSHYDPGSALLLGMLLLGWIATILLCVRQVHKLRTSVTSRERFTGFSRNRPHNISQIRIVKHHKDSILLCGPAPVSQSDEKTAPISTIEEIDEEQFDVGSDLYVTSLVPLK